MTWSPVRFGVVLTILALACGPTRAGEDKAAAAPEAKPKDETVDWLVDQGSEADAPKPDADPAAAGKAGGDEGASASPFAPKKDDNKNVRRGVITLSDGEQVRGRIGTTRGKPLRVWDAKNRRYRDVPFHLVKSAAAEVAWERDEREWHFKESGSDIKEYSGKTYPARELRYTLTLLNGQTITGGIVAPLYVERKNDDPVLFTLNKRTKGEVGQSLDDLVYVARVEFEGKPAAKRAKGGKGGGAKAEGGGDQGDKASDGPAGERNGAGDGKAVPPPPPPREKRAKKP